MSLELLPDHRDVVICVGTSVRKPLDILQAHLASLEWQELPPRTRVVPVYVPDFTADQQDALEYLYGWMTFRRGTLIDGAPPSNQPDFSDGPGLDSHVWTPGSMARVAYNKNRIIQYALSIRADYVFFCDTDLILDRYVLRSLLGAEQAITTAVYWTHWSKSGSASGQIHAAPQVWLNHPYTLEGRGLDAAQFRRELVRRQLTQVWGYGACTLVQRSVLEAGVNYEYLPDVPQQGMMAGEDRHFCIRAERLHKAAWADPWPDIFHIYHDDDRAHIPLMSNRLGMLHPRTARVGDLVSLKIRAVEPKPVGPGQYRHVAPQHVRGRLGAIPLAPELEEAVLDMTRGERRIVQAHHPVHHEQAWLRNRTCLYEVTLIDCKPVSCTQPVLDEELMIGAKGGKILDSTTLTMDQINNLKDIAAANV